MGIICCLDEEIILMTLFSVENHAVVDEAVSAIDVKPIVFVTLEDVVVYLCVLTGIGIGRLNLTNGRVRSNVFFNSEVIRINFGATLSWKFRCVVVFILDNDSEKTERFVSRASLIPGNE